MDQALYNKQDSWYGLVFELAIEFHPKGNDRIVLDAIEAMWQHPRLHGPLPRPAWLKGDHIELLNSTRLEAGGCSYGLLQMPDDRMLGCETLIVREETDRDGYLSDWLDLCVPSGMVGLVYPETGYQTKEHSQLLQQLYDVYLDIAQQVYAAAGFTLALIGEEVSGMTDGHQLSNKDLESGGVIAPSPLLDRLGLNRESVQLPRDLRWFPPTYLPGLDATSGR